MENVWPGMVLLFTTLVESYDLRTAKATGAEIAAERKTATYTAILPALCPWPLKLLT